MHDDDESVKHQDRRCDFDDDDVEASRIVVTFD